MKEQPGSFSCINLGEQQVRFKIQYPRDIFKIVVESPFLPVRNYNYLVRYYAGEFDAGRGENFEAIITLYGMCMKSRECDLKGGLAVADNSIHHLDSCRVQAGIALNDLPRKLKEKIQRPDSPKILWFPLNYKKPGGRKHIEKGFDFVYADIMTDTTPRIFLIQVTVSVQEKKKKDKTSIMGKQYLKFKHDMCSMQIKCSINVIIGVPYRLKEQCKPGLAWPLKLNKIHADQMKKAGIKYKEKKAKHCKVLPFMKFNPLPEKDWSLV